MSAETTHDVVVTDDTDNHRFVATVDGSQAGFVVYYLSQGRYLLVHTEVDEQFQGEGVGSQLVRGTLDQIRDAGRSVVPLCPYVKKWMGRHDDYRSLVDEELETLLRP